MPKSCGGRVVRSPETDPFVEHSWWSSCSVPACGDPEPFRLPGCLPRTGIISGSENG